MYRLLEVLSVDDGANLAGAVAGPIRSHDLDFRFARVNPAIIIVHHRYASFPHVLSRLLINL